jgi:hypothetical protein
MKLAGSSTNGCTGSPNRVTASLPPDVVKPSVKDGLKATHEVTAPLGDHIRGIKRNHVELIFLIDAQPVAGTVDVIDSKKR